MEYYELSSLYYRCKRLIKTQGYCIITNKQKEELSKVCLMLYEAENIITHIILIHDMECLVNEINSTTTYTMVSDYCYKLLEHYFYIATINKKVDEYYLVCKVYDKDEVDLNEEHDASTTNNNNNISSGSSN